ncbi:hypothetical protein DB346_11575 [Verrucomicrobia bacterium LW23]|nr:hypothetical protein DB346_11575 [Verrucomicrobia bacterium LW23]
MSAYEITPQVDAAQEFIEIANDFANPLDVVREAISNAFDAGATCIHVTFKAVTEYGNRILVISIKDDGKGMNKETLQCFFDLGNSSKRGDSLSIGEKGHGTKVYLNCSEITVITTQNEATLTALLQNPFQRLSDRQIPTVAVQENKAVPGTVAGTEIIIKGYNGNQRQKFRQAILKDHIQWFTKMASFEGELLGRDVPEVTVYLQGLDASKPEAIKIGHPFPPVSKSVNDLFDQYKVNAPDWYCNKVVKSGNLKKAPEISFDAVFYIEGNRVKLSHNSMLRRPGRARFEGDYTVQERYGLWLCKDFIPIQRKNEWITFKGSEYTKFHAFVNCQALKLTANRGSIDNTPSDIIDDLRESIMQIYDDIVSGEDWINISYLENEAEAYRSTELETKSFCLRIKRAKRANIAAYKDVILIQPERESGVFSLVVQLMTLNKEIFPFEIVDYDTHQGIDVIVKSVGGPALDSSKLFYVEFKHTLSAGKFNHSFNNTHSTVCWDTDIKNDDTIEDFGGNKRIMKIAPPTEADRQTKYFLDEARGDRKIEVFVLKDFLKEKLGLEFRPRA